VAAAAVSLALLLGDGSSSPRRSSDLVCRPPSVPRATLLLFHPGGFVAGTAREFRRECELFAHRGYLAVSVEYSHKFVPAVHDAMSRAHAFGAAAHRARRPIFAYGVSAGGSFAAMLAARGEVDAGFSFAGVYDIAAWASTPSYIRSMGTTRAELVRLSPLNLPLTRPAPLLIAHNPHDIVAPYKPAVRMAHRSRRFRLQTVRRPVNGYAAHLAHPIAPALAFFSRHRGAP
jgi:dipeptidyl aminopeptidase/acylaminoacyl peptidase